MTVLVNYCFARSYLKLVKHFAYLSKNSVIDFYWDASEASHTSNQIVSGILSSPNFYDRHRRALEQRAQVLKHYVYSLNHDFVDVSDSYLSKAYQKYVLHFISAGYYVLWLRALVDQGPRRLEERLESKMNQASSYAMTVLTATPRRVLWLSKKNTCLK